MKLSNILWMIADILCLFQLVEADESILYKDLIKDYNKEIRPKINHKETVEVTVDFELRQIIDLNEKEEILSVAGFFIARWKDDHMVWNPADHGDIKSMVIPPNVIWLPDMGIENSADSFYHDTFGKDFHVRLYHDGSVQWAFGGKINTLCDLDVTYYPFDLQNCTIEIENWAYHGDEVQLLNKSHKIETRSCFPHGLWDLVKTTSEPDEDKYFWATGDDPHPGVKFTLYLKRKSQFYIVNLVLPCLLIILVALGVFWLPAESGEKVTLAVTLLLAFSVFQIVLADTMPANSDYSPVLSQLVVGIMTLSAISVLTSIIILYIHFKDPERTVPRCLRLIFFRYLATVVCLCGSAPTDMSDQVALSGETSVEMADIENAKGSSDRDIARISQNLVFIANKMKETQREEKIVKEWKFLALVLDRILFWMSAVVALIIFLVFLVREDSTF